MHSSERFGALTACGCLHGPWHCSLMLILWDLAMAPAMPEPWHARVTLVQCHRSGYCGWQKFRQAEGSGEARLSLPGLSRSCRLFQ